MSVYSEAPPVFHSDRQQDLGRSSNLLLVLSVHPQEVPSFLWRWRRSLYRRRPSEAMVDGALSWSVCRLAGETRRFDYLCVWLSSAIVRLFVVGASTVWRRVPPSHESRTPKTSRWYSSKKLLHGVFPSRRHRRPGAVERLSIWRRTSRVTVGRVDNPRTDELR